MDNTIENMAQSYAKCLAGRTVMAIAENCDAQHCAGVARMIFPGVACHRHVVQHDGVDGAGLAKA
jgi:hypothetical protein